MVNEIYNFPLDLSHRRSAGLQTTRVLAPIPKHAMEWTPGFPTKVRVLAPIPKFVAFVYWLDEHVYTRYQLP